MKATIFVNEAKANTELKEIAVVKDPVSATRKYRL